jgi:dihydroflavonol-4-reductase
MTPIAIARCRARGFETPLPSAPFAPLCVCVLRPFLERCTQADCRHPPGLDRVDAVKIFVTGGTGFIGGEIVRQLRDRGDKVVCLVRSPEKGKAVAALGCELAAGDLSDEAAIGAAMQGCDAVIHAAAMYEVGIPAKQRPAMWEANVAGTERVMKAALEAKIPKIVYVSTVGVFGNTHKQVVDETYEHPGQEFTSYYEETKLEAHKVVKRMIAEQNLPAIIVQPGGVYGPGDTSQVADLLQEFFAGKLPLLPFPELGICMSHVEDIAGGVLLALDKGRLGEIYVISGPATTMRGAIEVVASVSGRKAPKRNLPTPLMKALIPIGPLVGKMMGQPPNLRELISSGDGVTFWASYEKAERELGYSPRGLEEGLRQTLEGDDRFPAPAAA